MSAACVLSEHEIVLDKMTSERNHILDRWADPKALGLTSEEKALFAYQKANLKFLFGETGFNPPVPPRNPISVSTHNPRFGAALWAVNTEAYRRKGALSRSQKDLLALGLSLANQCPHCAFIHTAMGPAAGDDVDMTVMQSFYDTQDPDTAFPLVAGQNSMNHEFAAWAITHRDGEAKPLPCTPDQVPEFLGTVMLFSMLNRIVDAFVSKQDIGPMFPLPVRLMMRFESMTPMVQRMMAWMMSWMMHGEDKKITAGKCLADINRVAPIVKGFEGAADELPLPLPEAMSWAATGSNEAIGTTFAFLAAEAEILAECFVSPALKTHMESWVSMWDGEKIVPTKKWLESQVAESGFYADDSDVNDKADVTMLRLMLVTVVASPVINDTLLSECQAMLGFRGTHAAVLWSSFLAAQRMCQRAFAAGLAPVVLAPVVLAPVPPPDSD